MADIKKMSRVPADSSRINVHEKGEVDYWAKELGVSPDRLRELASKHGVMVEAVRKAIAAEKVTPKKGAA